MIRNDGFEMSGYLAFLTLISIFPCSIFLAKILSMMSGIFADYENEYFGHKIIDDFAQSFDFLSNLPLQTLKDDIKNIFVGPPRSIVSFAIFGILWTSSSTTQGLKVSLNRAYRAEKTKPYLIVRLYSILQFIFVSFITIIVMLILNIAPIFIKKFHIDELYVFGGLKSQYFNVAILWLYVVWLNKMLTNKKLYFSRIIFGSILTVCSWILSSKILMVYFAKFLQFNIIYGSLANIVSILLFFYVIFICFIFGAELNNQIEMVFIEDDYK